jgi:DNA polymerase sigma
MLPATLLRELDRRLGASVGENEGEMLLNRVLLGVAQENAYDNDQEAKQQLEDEVKLIEKALQKFSGLNIVKSKGLQLRLAKFGSLTSGFAGTDADLDLTILTNCYINEIEFLKLLHEFLKKEYKQEEGRGPRRVTVELISQAKTPLIQLSIGERGRVDMKIDLIVNNILGVINSKFLSVYSQVRWVKNLGLLAKLWGKRNNLIGKHALSSYAMVLMLIHYLIKSRRVRPILDHRITANQPYFDFKRMKQAEVEQFKVYYSFRDDPRDASIEERVNYYKIFLGFMKYYAEEHWKEDESTRIITVDMCIDRKVDSECALTIKDPFDEPHNPGRLKAESRDFLISKFKEAYEVLKGAKEPKIRSLFI